MQLERRSDWLKLVGLAFAVVTLSMLVVGRFWWPTENGDWLKSIRLGSFLAVIFLSLELFRERARLTSLPFLLYLVFWVGLMLNSILTDSPSSVKQLLVILFFTWVVMVMGGRESRPWLFVLGLDALAGAGFAGFSLINKAIMGQFDVGYRVMNIKDSGVLGIADFGITIEAGMHYAFCFIVAVWLLMRARSWAMRTVWLVSSLILFAYLYFTFARSAWVAGLMGAGLLVLCMTEGRQRIYAVGLSVLAGVAVLVFGFEQVAYEFGSRGLTYRDQIWRVVFERIGEAWWFGHGSHTELGKVTLSTGQIVRNPHSLYLEVLYQFGLVGLFTMLAAMAACLWGAWKARTEFSKLWFSIMAAAAVVMTVELHFFVAAPNLVWMWFWLPMAGCLAVATQHRVDRQS